MVREEKQESDEDCASLYVSGRFWARHDDAFGEQAHAGIPDVNVLKEKASNETCEEGVMYVGSRRE